MDPDLLSIYDYFITDFLKALNKLPLENQLMECRGSKVLILDYCGMSSKLFNLFVDCDVFLIENANENVFEICKIYDVVYILTYQLQSVAVEWPAIKIICYKNKIVETIA